MKINNNLPSIAYELYLEDTHQLDSAESYNNFENLSLKEMDKYHDRAVEVCRNV